MFESEIAIVTSFSGGISVLCLIDFYQITMCWYLLVLSIILIFTGVFEVQIISAKLG